jgi:hypothetical protein
MLGANARFRNEAYKNAFCVFGWHPFLAHQSLQSCPAMSVSSRLLSSVLYAEPPGL